MAWQGTELNDSMVWRGMVWHGTVQAKSKEDKTNLVPNVATTGCANGSTPMVWYGMVWYGMVWYGMVWYGKSLGMVW